MNRIASLVAAVALTVPAAALAQDACNEAGLIEDAGTSRVLNFSDAIPSLVAYHGVYGTYPIEREAAQAMSPAIHTGGGEVWLSLDEYKANVDRVGSSGEAQWRMVDATARELVAGAEEVEAKADGVSADIDALKKQAQMADEDHAAVKRQLMAAQRKMAWYGKHRDTDRRRMAQMKRYVESLRAEVAAAEAEVQAVVDALNEAVEYRAELNQASDSMHSGGDVFKTLSCVLGVAAGTDP